MNTNSPSGPGSGSDRPKGSTPMPPKSKVSREVDPQFTPDPDEVARRAYFTFLNHGSPLGQDVQHWLAAEAEILAERAKTRTHGFHNPT